MSVMGWRMACDERLLCGVVTEQHSCQRSSRRGSGRKVLQRQADSCSCQEAQTRSAMHSQSCNKEEAEKYRTLPASSAIRFLQSYCETSKDVTIDEPDAALTRSAS